MWKSNKIRMVMLLLSLAIGVNCTEAGQDQEGKDWQLAPRTGVLVEYGGFLYHDGPFSSLLRRRLEIDVLQYRRFIFYLEFDEETFLGTPTDRWEFNRVIYRLQGGFRYDLGNYYLGIFFRHWCANPFLTKDYPSRLGRINDSIYFITFEFMDKALRAGMADRGIVFDPNHPFVFLGHWHFGAWVSKTLDQPYFLDIDWVLRAKVRYDICRYKRFVPYLEAGGELRIGSTSRFGPWIEVGSRYHIRPYLDLIPFFQWRLSQEVLFKDFKVPVIQKVERQYVLGGLRLEYLVDASDFSDNLTEGWQLLPEIHGTALYLTYFRSRFFDWRGKIELNLDVLRKKPWTLFLYGDLNLDTKKGGFGPLKMIYRVQYGLTYTREPYFVDLFLWHSKRMDTRTYSNVTEKTNLVGLRLGTQGMKPGHQNYGISFGGPKKFQWLNNWQGQVSVGHYFQNRDWQYLWNTSLNVRWDLCRWRFLVPYIQGEFCWLVGGGQTSDAVEYAAETGVRFHGGIGDIVPFFRFQHQDNAVVFRGPADTQGILGVKFLF